MKRRRQFKVIAFLLALVRLFGMMPVTALETEIMTGETNIPEAETAVPSVGKEPNPDYVEESQTREVTERREVTNTIGLPQRVRTFGLMVVEYDMTDGNTLVVEYVRNSDGYFESASMKIEK